MNATERARAEVGMKQALLLADLTLAGVRHVRNALSSAGHAMSVVYGRSRVL
jgi:2-phospho-L-lactate guanylyltransferase (CobY/MobA/RfbA family)